MKPIYARRSRRTVPSAKEAAAFKKDSQQDTFFAAPSQQSFFQPHASLQRKCAHCEAEEKQVQKKDEQTGVKEDEKELHLKSAGDEEKQVVDRAPAAVEDEKKLQKAEEKEEKKVLRAAGKEEEGEPVARKEDAAPVSDRTSSVGAYIGSLGSRGQALPEEAQHFFGERMGHDFSGVRIHTGTEAEQSASAVNAKAYTVDEHIVFGKGQYDPSSGEGKKLLAHELTHVVQQGSSRVYRAVEHDAGSKQIRRRRGEAPNAHVGGEHGNVTFLEDGSGDVIAPGEGGYSRRALSETGSRSQGVFERLYADAVQSNVVIDNAQIETDKRARAEDKQWAVNKSEELFNTPSTTRRYMEAAEQCQQDINNMDRHKREEDQKTFAYNAWVPSANGFYVAMSRLEALQEMLGVDNPEQMVSAVTRELAQAQGLALSAQRQLDWGDRSAALPVPPVDDSVAEAAAQTTAASREMNVAYLGFQQNLMNLELRQTHAEGDQDRARLGEIDQVKAFVRRVGGTIDLTMSVVRGAPAAITNVTNRIQHAGASLNAARNRRQILAGETPRYNPTYLTVNEQGQMVVRNMQTRMDTTGERDSSGRMVQTSSPESPGLSLPTSVSDILGTIADFAYASEVREINNRLEQIKSRCSAISNSLELIQTREKAENFQSKLNIFAQRCNALQQRIAQRRQAYLEFGVALDNFARNNADARRAGIAPGREEERYATVMMITSHVREALAIGETAQSSFDDPVDFGNWALGIQEERSSPGAYRRMAFIRMGAAEWNSLNEMYGQVSRFHTNVNNVKSVLNPIAESGAAMMGAIHQGGGQGGVY